MGNLSAFFGYIVTNGEPVGHDITQVEIRILQTQWVKNQFLQRRFVAFAGHRLNDIARKAETGIVVGPDGTKWAQMYADKEAIVDVQSYEPERKEEMSPVKDVVCGMDIDLNTASSRMEYQGKIYYFCSDDCHSKFMREPQKYASQMVETGG